MEIFIAAHYTYTWQSVGNLISCLTEIWSLFLPRFACSLSGAVLPPPPSVPTHSETLDSRGGWCHRGPMDICSFHRRWRRRCNSGPVVLCAGSQCILQKCTCACIWVDCVHFCSCPWFSALSLPPPTLSPQCSLRHSDSRRSLNLPTLLWPAV